MNFLFRRDAQLVIKELQGNIKIEKKSKKSYKNKLILAKTEIQKCLIAKQIASTVADKINRHLELTEICEEDFI